MSYITHDNQARKSGMVASILLNGAIIGAVMLSPVIVETIKNPPSFTSFDVRAPSPPPEVKLQPDPAIEPLQTAPVFVPDPILVPPTDFPPVISTTDISVGDIVIDGTAGTEGGLSKDPPVPLFRAAQRDGRYAGAFQPDFPLRLLQRGIEGFVRIKVLIGIDGRVRQAIILEASEQEFGRATERKALSSWRFIPATRGKEKVEDWQILTVRFTINE